MKMAMFSSVEKQEKYFFINIYVCIAFVCFTLCLFSLSVPEGKKLVLLLEILTVLKTVICQQVGTKLMSALFLHVLFVLRK